MDAVHDEAGPTARHERLLPVCDPECAPLGGRREQFPVEHRRAGPLDRSDAAVERQVDPQHRQAESLGHHAVDHRCRVPRFAAREHVVRAEGQHDGGDTAVRRQSPPHDRQGIGDASAPLVVDDHLLPGTLRNCQCLQAPEDRGTLGETVPDNQQGPAGCRRRVTAGCRGGTRVHGEETEHRRREQQGGTASRWQEGHHPIVARWST